MCRPVRCKVCEKTTWAGCGQHISQVKAQVPSGQWCNGKHTQAEKEAASAKSGGGFFARLFSSRRS
ncbi:MULTISPECIES: hypothetical protein [Brevibacterium]|uniref:Uncharacterized protein n=1 Tax=Brevibacterium luteolum TaxID=199591 RepID=A0A849AS99_9MICO|nr:MULTISPECIES: hypothetical protein [Brevibacterium]MBM7530313.1 hypothetical protein [Brevibacterium luteolum]MBU8578863.1 hypothetical protein [Brevibacterium luteolum]MCT1657083.1 hypothetical protein [Brevibacterium luteolum]MCT1690778.1 hypothetical protein [Brevibacterium sp. p3-SID960]MCT1921000.1 hypothetical protein [Brevibacterium luteolum]